MRPHPAYARSACLFVLWTVAGSLPADLVDRLDYCAHGLALHHTAAAVPVDSPDYRKYAPDRLVDIEHLRLDITPDFERRSIAGQATLTFAPIGKPLRELRLNAVDLRIAEVDSSAALEGHENSGTELILTFADPVPAGQRVELSITYSAEPQAGLYFRTPAMGYRDGDTQLWTQGEPEMHRNWFPSHDYPNEMFTTEVLCRAPDGMTVLSNGRLVSEELDADSGLRLFHWRHDYPHVNYLISLVAGHFFHLEDRHGDLPLAFYVPPSEKDQAAGSFRDTKAIMEFFEEEIGVPYPWDKYYNVCAIDYMMGGMENTSLTTLTTRTLFSADTENLFSTRSLDAHELAHQWFGDLVTCRDWSHIWLNEGFATYYSLLFDRHLLGRDEFLFGLRSDARQIFANAKDEIPMLHRAYGQPMEQFSFRAYPKGSWVLHMLRTQLGEDLFRRCVQTYLERHRHATVVTQDLIDIIEELSGRSWERFFDQWVRLSGYPSLAAAHSWDETTNQLRLTIEQTQDINEKRPLFHFPLPVRVITAEGQRDFLAQIREKKEDFYFTLPSRPEALRIDPDLTVLAQVSLKIAPGHLERQLADPHDVIGRVLAVEQLSEAKDSQAVERLANRLAEDPFYGVRIAAAAALQKIASDEALAALLASAAQADARVRNRVVEAIAAFYCDQACDVLLQTAEAEPNPAIRATAIRSLGSYHRPSLGESLLGWLQVDGHRDRVAAAALHALRDQGNSEFVPTLLATLKTKGSSWENSTVASALEALGSLGREAEDRVPVRSRLLEMTSDPRRSVRQAALRGLGHLGDPAALPALGAMASADRDSDEAKQARSAMEAIRKNQPDSENLTRMRQEISELQGRLQALSADMGALRKQLQERLKPEASTDKTPEAAPAPNGDEGH
ncbi:MAG TPA: M1 family aminopeptidase [Verrucomicrobiales bacterium]|nr:M1 family aminopeptidase [Verrucomicrobiales bacterium]